MNNRYNYYYPNQNDERFIGGGVVAPLLLGGVFGYALGNNNNGRPMVFYPTPRPYYPMYYNPYYYPYYRNKK